MLAKRSSLSVAVSYTCLSYVVVRSYRAMYEILLAFELYEVLILGPYRRCLFSESGLIAIQIPKFVRPGIR